MAGQDPTGGFDAAEFRSGVMLAMDMGLPNDPALRPTFRFPHESTYSTADSRSQPWDWTATPSSTSPDPPRDPVQVPCAVEYSTADIVDFRPGAQLNPGLAIITLLDAHWAQVDGFHEVDLGGNVYVYSKATHIALFEVDVVQVEVRARDEA